MQLQLVECAARKYLEDGKFEIAVAPFGPTGDVDMSKAVKLGGF